MMDIHERHTLIEQNLDRAYRYAHHVAPRHVHIDKSDVRSSAHLGLLRAARRYHAAGSTFWSYAKHYVRGAVKDLARKRALPYAYECDASADVYQDDDILARITLRRLLEQLPDEGRRVLVSYDIEGKTLRQIGADLGRSASYVGRIRRDMLAHLRKRHCIAEQSNVAADLDQPNETRDSWI